eukprot:SAG31_NODE_1857_length_7062_cov_6.624587_11_plen_68_part_00
MVGATRTVTADLAAALTPPPQTADARELAMRLQRRYYLSVVELVDETSQKQQVERILLCVAVYGAEC